MKIARFGVGVAVILVLTAAGAQAGPHGPDLREGILYGVIVDAATQKPLAGATVAAFDHRGHPIAWGRTDASGRYALVAPPLHACNLEKEGRGGGLLTSICRGVGKVVGGAVDITLGAAKTVAGVTVGQKTAVVAASALSAAQGRQDTGSQVKAQVAAQSAGMATEKVKGTLGLEPPHGAHGHGAEHKTRQTVPSLQPGQVLLEVSMPDYQDFQGPSSVYWMEPPAQQNGKVEVGPQAWLDPILLAPAGKDVKSRSEPMRILVQDARIEPDLATPGTPVKVSAAVSAPKQPGLDYRVFLVDSPVETAVELKPSGDGRYSGEYRVSGKHPIGATVLTIAALRTRPVTVDISRAKTDPLPRLAANLEDLKPDATYEYDPRILASQNRLDLKFVVLDPKQGITDPSAIPTQLKPGAIPLPSPGAGGQQPAAPPATKPAGAADQKKQPGDAKPPAKPDDGKASDKKP